MIRSQAPQEFETLLPVLVRPHAGMGFVHDNKRRAGACEALAPALGFDVVEAHHGCWIGVENRLRGRKAALQPRSRSGRHCDRIDIEFGLELAGPLLDEMRRTQDRKPICFAAIDQLAQNEASLDRLADADIIRDQQTHGGKPERHQQWNQLIGPRLKT